jgi:transposase
MELAAELKRQKVTLVVMEATGDYWKPFYYLLGDMGLPVMLVNARQARQIPGRKTDVNDAMWLADLGAHGLVHGSFVAPPEIRELKDLTRARTILIRLRGQEAQRLEKLLESAAVKLSSTISDITGASGRRMLDAMIAGTDDPEALADLAGKRLKASRDDLREALTGRFTDHHGFLTQVHLDLIDSYNTKIEQIEQRIDTYFDDTSTGSDRVDVCLRHDLGVKRTLLTSIPGIGESLAERILAEIGPDMTVFPTPARLTSWAGVAPGANESAGKVRSSHCRPGNSYLKAALGTSALVASRTNDTFLAARYKRVASRRGHLRALVALERTILVAVWNVLSTNQPYVDLGGDYYARRRPAAMISKAINQLKQVGVNITFTSPTTAVVT